VIALRAKGVEFETTYIDLRNKPDWFLKISPHGKVPVLSVDDAPLFESNAIAEYLDDVVSPRLHPDDPLKRARNRAWTDFVPDFARALSSIYYATTAEAQAKALDEAPDRVVRVERALADERGNDGPYFNGERLSLVDAAYAPFLQRFELVEERMRCGLLNRFPLVQAWADALIANETVRGSVPPEFEEAFAANLKRRGCVAATLFPTP
jgi:glutathione S-transferase